MNSGQTKRIVFFGNERLISGLPSTDAPVLTSLIAQGYNVVAVVSHHSETKSRKPKPLEVGAIAKQHNIPLFLPDRPADIFEELRNLQPDAAVLAAYGRIISQAVIDLFPYGIINIHPSLLPKYRGPSPIETTILQGDLHAGVSIMQLSAAMDAGPLFRQDSISITGTETAEDLCALLSREGARLLIETLPHILNASLTPTPQNDQAATYTHLIKKSDGIIDWTQTGASIERHIRAYHAWPQSRTRIGDVDVIITQAQTYLAPLQKPGTVTATPDELFIYASDIALRIKALKPVGKKEMPVKAFLSGYRSRLPQ